MSEATLQQLFVLKALADGAHIFQADGKYYLNHLERGQLYVHRTIFRNLRRYSWIEKRGDTANERWIISNDGQSVVKRASA